MEDSNPPLIPLRMLNEFVYCPRLAILEWVDGEFAHSADTVEGSIRHATVDQPGRRIRRTARSSHSGDEPSDRLPEIPDRTLGSPEDVEQHRAVELCDQSLGITGKLDLVEVQGGVARPVDTKKGKRPHVAKQAYEPERVQVCGQGLLLRANGWACDAGAIYFAGSGERVDVPFDGELICQTREKIKELQTAAMADVLPPPLEDSPKCVRCSLVSICLPDETRRLSGGTEAPRRLLPASVNRFPLYVQTPGAQVRKKGDLLEVWDRDERVGEMRLMEISTVALFGRAHITEPALRELMNRGVPLLHLSHGGWLHGVTEGLPHKNIRLRQCQYRAADDLTRSLEIARRIVHAKIANQRVFLRRNAPEPLPRKADNVLRNAAKSALSSSDLGGLLGHEGTAARLYFGHLSNVLRSRDTESRPFDFRGRNRRPPRDPVNALLSFSYALLVKEWVAVCRGVGFDPYLGFLHQPRHGRPALALDLMEAFRPILADSVVVRAINNGELGHRDFVERFGAVNLTSQGRRRFLQAFERRLAQEITHPTFGYRISYRRVFEVEARCLARHLMGEAPAYAPLITR